MLQDIHPLRLAFAQTTHNFQGQNVGPVRLGQAPNSIQKLVCDPGTRRFNGDCIGLFYTILSRVTTFGNPLDKFSSAIYFTGRNMNTERILNITLNEKGQMYTMAQRRQLYVEYLQIHEHDSKMSASDQNEILNGPKPKLQHQENLREIV